MINIITRIGGHLNRSVVLHALMTDRCIIITIMRAPGRIINNNPSEWCVLYIVRVLSRHSGSKSYTAANGYNNYNITVLSVSIITLICELSTNTGRLFRTLVHQNYNWSTEPPDRRRPDVFYFNRPRNVYSYTRWRSATKLYDTLAENAQT